MLPSLCLFLLNSILLVLCTPPEEDKRYVALKARYEELKKSISSPSSIPMNAEIVLNVDEGVPIVLHGALSILLTYQNIINNLMKEELDTGNDVSELQKEHATVGKLLGEFECASSSIKNMKSEQGHHKVSGMSPASHPDISASKSVDVDQSGPSQHSLTLSTTHETPSKQHAEPQVLEHKQKDSILSHQPSTQKQKMETLTQVSGHSAPQISLQAKQSSQTAQIQAPQPTAIAQPVSKSKEETLATAHSPAEKVLAHLPQDKIAAILDLSTNLFGVVPSKDFRVQPAFFWAHSNKLFTIFGNGLFKEAEPEQSIASFEISSRGARFEPTLSVRYSLDPSVNPVKGLQFALKSPNGKVMISTWIERQSGKAVTFVDNFLGTKPQAPPKVKDLLFYISCKPGNTFFSDDSTWMIISGRLLVPAWREKPAAGVIVGGEASTSFDTVNQDNLWRVEQLGKTQILKQLSLKRIAEALKDSGLPSATSSVYNPPTSVSEKFVLNLTRMPIDDPVKYIKVLHPVDSEKFNPLVSFIYALHTDGRVDIHAVYRIERDQTGLTKSISLQGFMKVLSEGNPKDYDRVDVVYSQSQHADFVYALVGRKVYRIFISHQKTAGLNRQELTKFSKMVFSEDLHTNREYALVDVGKGRTVLVEMDHQLLELQYYDFTV